MKTPLEVQNILGTYRGLIDGVASKFLDRGTYDMYGMMRYFMGYTDEQFRNIHVEFGGKRFRSGLCLLIADCYGVKESAVSAALSIELFHNFTLIHDDIVDHDEFRRGRKTVWALWGVDHAINTGDAQLIIAIEALETLATAHQSDVRLCLLNTYREVAEGQYLDFSLTSYRLDDPRVSEVSYLEMLTKKTSVLVAAAAQCAGKIKGVGSDEEALLWQYGLSLGLAYQLCDDVVSIWGSSDMTGKQAHGDVREKKKTLPVLYAKEQLDTKERAELISLYNASQSLDEITVMRIIELLNSVEAYAYARKRITQYRNEACEVANRLSISDEHKNTLIALVDALLPEVEM